MLEQIMVSSLKHYADNLLCMDLCCLPQYQAEQIVGRDVRYSNSFSFNDNAYCH